MRKTTSSYYLIFLAFLAISAGLHAQDPTAEFPADRIKLCTDRTLYISGEKILFSALVFNEDKISEGDYSRILYCELITPDGNRVAAGKYPVENISAQGCLTIPDETMTGIYYLKSYTRWMRNGGPSAYHYILLKVVNPYKADVLSGNESEEAWPYNPGKPDKIPVRVSADKKIYQVREAIEIKIDGGKMDDFAGKIALSVVPFASWDSIPRDSIPRDSIPPNLQYYPETRGISISGRLLETESGLHVPNALVNLSIIGDKDAMAIRTSASGQFYFALPAYTGNKDIFLCGEDIPGKSTSVYIDNDFCSRPVNLPSPVFHLTEKEKETVYDMAVNQKITSVFFNDTTSGKIGLQLDDRPFYGEPDEILVMDKFIDLPTIEDYFSELLGSVNVRKSQDRKVFRFNSARTEMTIYDPLVLIDWVAVNDIGKILAMSPKAIDRIELVDAPYVKGNITYGGIISFLSKKNNFAGIDLPTSGTFINYKFLEDCSQNIISGELPANIPDSRNTIYWNPNVQTDEKGSAEISFTAPDTPGKYIIVLKCMDGIGEDYFIREEINVVK